MANALYDRARQRFLNGQLSWNTQNFKVVLVDTADYTVNASTHNTLADIPPAARVATSANLGGMDTTAGVADASDVTLSGVSGDQSEALVIYADLGTADTDKPLVAYIDSATGLAITPNGGDIIIQWDNGTNKIFKL